MTDLFRNILLLIICFLSIPSFGQNYSDNFSKVIDSRIRIIIDNDFGGDPDGLFQLAHHLLSPTVEVKAIIGSKHHKRGFYGLSGSPSYACTLVNELLDVMQLNSNYSVFEGADIALTDISTPVETEATKAIIKEAMRDDTKKPLYVVCGAGLTNIASALLIEPQIAKRLTLVWIGGEEYKGLAYPPPGKRRTEYNTSIDIKASQVVFNHSEVPIWQVPRNAYRQALVSYPEIVYKVKDKGETGKYLVEKLEDLMIRANRRLGEAYVLGDNPLVSLTALQSSWEVDPSSSKYVLKPVPKINDTGFYEENPEGREIRVYMDLDIRLMFEDFIAKLALFDSLE
jgi:inosine-uridine nucleoside N-ribohydrolase